jgi:hypothetical protein
VQQDELGGQQERRAGLVHGGEADGHDGQQGGDAEGVLGEDGDAEGDEAWAEVDSTSPIVMPTQVGIHDFSIGRRGRHGCRPASV